MENLNWLPVFLSALIPLIVGFVWYNEKVFGTAWMKETGMTPEAAKNANMKVIFGTTLLFSVMLATVVVTFVIHQIHVGSIFADPADQNDPNITAYLADFMAKYGNKFRTFRHGVVHGLITSIFFVLPVLGINALFERKSFKYIFINWGYWAVTLMLMGGVICQFA